MKGKDYNSYGSILKSTSLFGGVQVFQVMVNLVRGKLVALLLGPAGMGISALFVSSATTIQRFASLGLNSAIVKETAARSDSPEDVAAVIVVARRLIMATALVGALLCILFSPLLSRLTFGDDSMTLQFVLLGVVVGLSIAFNGKLSLLQGLREVKRISRASVFGAVAGLAIGVPLYYLFGNDAIVPAMVLLSLAMYLFYTVALSRSLHLPTVKFVWISHKPIVKSLVILGLLLMSNELLFSLVQYIINVYIKRFGTTDIVGLYQAANSITGQYSGMVFAAMAMDFFPRLAKVAADNVLLRKVVNRQSEIVALIISPASGLLILTAPLLIRILLSSEFLPVTSLMRWMGVGVLLKALLFPMGYIAFAKGNRRVFFWMEGIFCNLLTLVYSCLFYHWFGLVGLGYALVADNATCLVVYYVVNRRLYGYRFERDTAIYYAAAIISVLFIFGSSFISSVALSYSLMALGVVVSSAWSLAMLRQKIKRQP